MRVNIILNDTINFIAKNLVKQTVTIIGIIPINKKNIEFDIPDKFIDDYNDTNELIDLINNKYIKEYC